MTIDNFVNSLLELGIKINDNQLNQLNMYYELLVEWNKKINLTGITIKEDVYLKHFYDSATLAKIINLSNITSFCDIGTGAGFPGLVIKILFPKIHVTLIDSLNKRIVFLNDVVKKIGLKDIDVICSRAEDYSKKNREKFQLVTARAVAKLPILLEYSIPLVKKDYYFIAMKSDVTEEIKTLDNCCKVLNIELLDKKEFLLPIEKSKRTLIKFKKNNKTNMMYPRKYSDIKKKPL